MRLFQKINYLIKWKWCEKLSGCLFFRIIGIVSSQVQKKLITVGMSIRCKVK